MVNLKFTFFLSTGSNPVKGIYNKKFLVLIGNFVIDKYKRYWVNSKNKLIINV